MHYATKQKQTIEAYETEVQEILNQVHHLKCYLQSSKFDVDTTVQTTDVLTRLCEVTNQIHDFQFVVEQA